MSEYLALFLLSLLAATLLPGGSELLLAGLANEGLPPLTLWFWATLGNTLGALVNYALGRYCLHYQHKRWFPIKPNQLERSQAWFQRYGLFSLLFAWLPILGDPLTFIAGIMRVNWLWFVMLVAVGKGVRYALILWVFFEISH